MGKNKQQEFAINDTRLNPGQKGIKKKSKIRELIDVETRISLFQTAMNNAGRNFEGKSVKVKKMADFASQFYKLAIKEIEGIGQLNIQQMAKTIKSAPVKKVAKKSSIQKLMKKVKSKRGKK